MIMILLLVMVYLIDALSYTATKVALLYAHPIMCMALRMLMAGTILTSFVYYRLPQQWSLVRSTWYNYRALWFKIVIIYLYITYIGFFIGMQWMSSAYVALLYNLTPLIIALLGYFLTDQYMNFYKWIALILGFTSIVPIVMSNYSFLTPIGLAEVIMLLSVCSMAYGWFIVQALMQLGHSPLIINGIGMTGAGVLALVTSLWCEGSVQERWLVFKTFCTPVGGTQVPALVILMGSLFCSVIAVELIFYNATAFFMRYYSLVFISFVGMLTPIMVALFDWMFFGQSLPSYFIPSFTLLTVSLLLFHQQELISFIQRKDYK